MHHELNDLTSREDSRCLTDEVEIRRWRSLKSMDGSATHYTMAQNRTDKRSTAQLMNMDRPATAAGSNWQSSHPADASQLTARSTRPNRRAGSIVWLGSEIPGCSYRNSAPPNGL